MHAVLSKSAPASTSTQEGVVDKQQAQALSCMCRHLGLDWGITSASLFDSTSDGSNGSDSSSLSRRRAAPCSRQAASICLRPHCPPAPAVWPCLVQRRYRFQLVHPTISALLPLSFCTGAVCRCAPLSLSSLLSHCFTCHCCCCCCYPAAAPAFPLCCFPHPCRLVPCSAPAISRINRGLV